MANNNSWKEFKGKAVECVFGFALLVFSVIMAGLVVLPLVGLYVLWKVWLGAPLALWEKLVLGAIAFELIVQFFKNLLSLYKIYASSSCRR